MKRALLGLALFWVLALALFTPLGSADQGLPGAQVVLNGYDLWSPLDFEYSAGCGGSDSSIGPSSDEESFFFVEQSLTEAVYPGLDFETTCGTASYQLQGPAGVQSIGFAFNSSREIEEAADQGVTNDFLQQVRFLDPANQVRGVIDYFGPREVSVPDTEFLYENAFSTNGINTQQSEVHFYFEDTGNFVGQNAPNFVSAGRLAATVTPYWISYNGVPLPAAVQMDATGVSSSGVDERAKVTMGIPLGVEAFEFLELVLVTDDPFQVSVEDGFVELRSGSLVYRGEVSSALAVGGRIQTKVFFEDVPPPGSYSVSIQRQVGGTGSVALLVFAGAIAASPLILGFAAMYRQFHFRQRAFGAYRRAATVLLVATGALILYIITVLILGVRTGDVLEIVELPLGGLGYGILFLLFLSATVFALLYAAANHLDGIVRGTEDAAGFDPVLDESD